MEKQLEHKIKETYNKKDSNSFFGRKEQLWSKISIGLGHTSGVAALWRVVAIILALLSFGGVFGTINYVQNLKSEKKEIEKQLIVYQRELDSVSGMEPEIIVETLTVEKEKIVYRETRSAEKIDENTEVIIANLEDKINKLTYALDNANGQLLETKTNLEIALAENERLTKTEEVVEKKPVSNFMLKTEREKESIQSDRTYLNPQFKVKLFKIQDNMRYDSNATIFKK